MGVEGVEVDGGHVVQQRDGGELTRVEAECGELHLRGGDGRDVGNTEIFRVKLFIIITHYYE